jgi:hypothetical protein
MKNHAERCNGVSLEEAKRVEALLDLRKYSFVCSKEIPKVLDSNVVLGTSGLNGGLNESSNDHPDSLPGSKICGKRFSTQRDLEQHQKYPCHDEYPWKCKNGECDQVFRSYAGLKAHQTNLGACTGRKKAVKYSNANDIKGATVPGATVLGTSVPGAPVPGATATSTMLQDRKIWRCPVPGCLRGRKGNGCAWEQSLADHMRKVHGKKHGGHLTDKLIKETMKRMRRKIMDDAENMKRRKIMDDAENGKGQMAPGRGRIPQIPQGQVLKGQIPRGQLPQTARDKEKGNDDVDDSVGINNDIDNDSSSSSGSYDSFGNDNRNVDEAVGNRNESVRSRNESVTSVRNHDDSVRHHNDSDSIGPLTERESDGEELKFEKSMEGIGWNWVNKVRVPLGYRLKGDDVVLLGAESDDEDAEEDSVIQEEDRGRGEDRVREGDSALGKDRKSACVDEVVSGQVRQVTPKKVRCSSMRTPNDPGKDPFKRTDALRTHIDVVQALPSNLGAQFVCPKPDCVRRFIKEPYLCAEADHMCPEEDCRNGSCSWKNLVGPVVPTVRSGLLH